MTRLDRRALLAGLAATTALAGCGETLDLAGAKPKPKGGIGGTGIVGTLTDFGSLIVNGLRVEKDGDTRITDALGSVSEDTLAVGQNLTIEAATVDGVLLARRVHLTHPVIGCVGARSPWGGRVLVAGVPVVPEPGMIGELTPGTRVAVSGAWRGTEVVASRVDTRVDGPTVIAGVVSRPGGLAGIAVGGRRIIEGSSFLPAPGRFATVIGENTSRGLLPERIVAERFTGAAGPLQGLSIEGFLEPVAEAPFYTVSGLGHSFDAAAQLAPFEAQRSVFAGGYDGTFVVYTALEMPAEFEARRARIRAALAGEANPVTVAR